MRVNVRNIVNHLIFLLKTAVQYNHSCNTINIEISQKSLFGDNIVPKSDFCMYYQ